MSVESKGGRGYVSESSLADDDSLYPIHGVAIGPNDITIGHKSGERKLWKPDVLREAASTLQGREIVVNHENKDSYKLIGEVEEARYKDGEGVIYKGVVDDEEIASKIGHGWLEVSPRILHSKEHEELENVKVPHAIRRFDNLSVVTRGASPSNTVNLGDTEELMTAEELQDEFEDGEFAEYQSFEVEELADIDYTQHLYDNREGAQGASQSLGCMGYHEVEFEGETMYMPCDSRQSFLNNLSESEENSECTDCNGSGDDIMEIEELEKMEIGRRQIGSALSNIWQVPPERALRFINAMDPNEQTDRKAIAELLCEEYDGMKPVDVQSTLADAEMSYKGKDKDKEEEMGEGEEVDDSEEVEEEELEEADEENSDETDPQHESPEVQKLPEVLGMTGGS